MRVFLSILVFIATPVFAYYNPGSPQGFINDYANIIDDGLEQQLEGRLANFETETSNEIAVATVQNLDGDYIENFAEKLFKEWGIGKADKDNGVLLLVALEDRKMRIEVGYGLEGALTDAQSNWIINNEMKPAFRDENYGEGIDKAVNSIIGAAKGEYVPSDNSAAAGANGWDYEFILWIAIFGFMWLASVLGRSKSWWAGGVIGGIIGLAIALIWGFLWIGILAMVVLIPFGLGFDYIISKQYHAAKAAGRRLPWWIGGGRGGGFGGSSGGFGGFGGGFSGGGGSSGSW